MQKIIETNLHSNHKWLYKLANTFLDEDTFLPFDKKAYLIIEQNEYYELWIEGLAKCTPIEYINNHILNDSEKAYLQIENWISKQIVTSEIIAKVLLTYIEGQVIITEKTTFYKLFYRIKYLLLINNYYLEQVERLNNDSYNIILRIS